MRAHNNTGEGPRTLALSDIPGELSAIWIEITYPGEGTDLIRKTLDQTVIPIIIEAINYTADLHSPPAPKPKEPGPTATSVQSSLDDPHDPEYRKQYAEEFGRFCATKKKCNNLGAALEEFFDENVHKGPLYLGKLYIEDMKGSPEAAKGRWRLLLDRSEYQSNDLAELEWMLFDFAKREGFIAAYEHEAYPAQSSLDISTAPDVTDDASAEAFVRWCCQNIGRGFHPDNPMADYIDSLSAIRPYPKSFSAEDAAALQTKLDRAYAFLTVPGAPDIYGIGLDEMHKLQEDR